MAIVTIKDGLHSLDYTQKIGLPNGYGHFRFGWSPFGLRDDFAGYYQRRRGINGPIIVKMRPYWPPQNPGPAEQSRRQKFADGVELWHGLTLEQKQFYNSTGNQIGQSGFTRFMSLHMRDLL